MKSEDLILENERTKQQVAESENEVEGKILGLFDDDSYRQEHKMPRISARAILESYSLYCVSLSSFLVFVLK